MKSRPREIDILGMPLTVLASPDDAANHVVDCVQRGQRTFCIAMNPEKSYRAQRSKSLKQIIKSAELHICDGIGMAIAARVLHRRKVVRVTGVDLFQKLIARAQKLGLKVFLFGATPESNAGACKSLRRMYPQLRIVGSQHGYHDNDADVVDAVNASGADMLFVAMGSPRQETWIAAHRDSLNVPYCMGVGGSFDVLSGCAKRAPKVFCATGTEFLYRFAKEPKRWKRELCVLAFCGRVCRAKMSGWLRGAAC